jgi:hypothetical protein
VGTIKPDWLLHGYPIFSTPSEGIRFRIEGPGMTSKFGAVTVVGLMIACSAIAHGQVGRTEITKWQYGKSGAVSLTYDDGTINQFRVAVPIMDTFGFPATFFIITGNIPGSQYQCALIVANSGSPAGEADKARNCRSGQQHELRTVSSCAQRRGCDAVRGRGRDAAESDEMIVVRRGFVG